MFDFGELFTHSVRRVVPLLLEKKLACSFDCRGPRVMVRGDANAVRRSLHRLMCGLVDLLDVGFAVLHAETQLTRPGKCAIAVKLAGAGLVASNGRIDRVLERLELTEDHTPPGADRPRLRRADGSCPSTGAAVRFASLPAEGMLFAIEWQFPLDAALDAMEPVNARQARAWIIHDDDVACESLSRRLQRIGWATAKFDGPSSAARRLRAMPGTNARPALVVAAECASVSPSAVQCLRPYLPAWTSAIYGALPGSPTLAHPHVVQGFDVKVLPLSPVELHTLTSALSPEVDEPSGSTMPAPLLMADRPLVLVAAGNECSGVSASALLESLGYETQTAEDGLDVVEKYCRLNPAVVLLDTELSRLDGLTLVQQLRSLERRGEAVPSVIVAMSPDSSTETVQACQAAGMDGHVEKPLALPSLRAELRRLCAVGR